MFLSPNRGASNQAQSTASNTLSLPPHLQLKTILPNSSHGQSPPYNTSSSSPRVSSPGLPKTPSSMAARRHAPNALQSSRDMGERRYTPRAYSNSDGGNSLRDTRRSSTSFSGGIFGAGSWKGTGKWIFFGSGAVGSNESERGLSAEEKLRRVLQGSNMKGKAIDRRT